MPSGDVDGEIMHYDILLLALLIRGLWWLDTEDC
jgi:hypothetical protein